MTQFFAAALGPHAGGQSSLKNVFDWGALLEVDTPRAIGGWSTPEAFLAVLFSAVTCDGELAPVEHESLLALVHRSRALKSLSVAELAELNLRIVDRLRSDPQALRAACSEIPTEMRLPLFSQSLDLLLSDGDLNSDEADFLNTLILHLKLNREDVERIADVITLKNQI
jgi:uncharacterized tellurite resistance protein B-like protein